ncbi:HpcH/HpaI aldolase family protein [Arthrobacter sp. MMS18-M83]|uniref:HpcH/HpaI aldolase family protein n=1 Tax=Arthrobacter sp. MMS18-M83 TaxID=2996261 RepID=UPI00227C6787|nr:aldolase/citrate lyase family protein [Arthrobacter sp. MMS18-M83]WAH95637.1 aldolase/citrate lyase family protein [Arthrobacter sp. MMS18-M83]
MTPAPMPSQLTNRFGAWLTFLDAHGIEVLSGSGFDWIGIDLQHGTATLDGLPGLLRACEINRTPALVRTSGHSAAEIGRALDAGAAGVVVPMVESAVQAAAIAAACAFPPEGVRSSGASRSAIAAPSLLQPEGKVLCLAMIESAAGLANAEEIAETEGIDGIFLGPYDLALSLRASGVTDPITLDAISHVLAVARRLGKLTGAFSGSAQLSGALRDADLLAVDSDLAFLRSGAEAKLTDTRAALSAARV